MPDPEPQREPQSQAAHSTATTREPPRVFLQQLAWYDTHATYHRLAYLLMKAAQILVSAAIPVLALVKPGAPAVYNGVLGAVVLVIEGFQQLFQSQQNWIRYRATCEGLRREGLLYSAGAGPYAAANEPAVLLVERMDALISAENKGWSSLQEQTTATAKRA